MSLRKKYIIAGIIIFTGQVVLIPLIKLLQGGIAPPVAVDKSKVKGPFSASIWIQEFSDFQCPACQKATQVMDSILKKYEGKIRVSFFHYPLRMHNWAMLAHQCGECAARQGKFWEYHDLLYQYQSVWSKLADPKETFKGYAKQLSLNEEDFALCLQDKTVADKIAEDVKKGQDLQVRSTPTFLVNNRRVIGGKTFEADMNKVIEEELKSGL